MIRPTACPQKQAAREELAKQIAEWEKRSGPVQLAPVTARGGEQRRGYNGGVRA